METKYTIQENTRTLVDAITTIKKIEQNVARVMKTHLCETAQYDTKEELNKLIEAKEREMYEKTSEVLNIIKATLHEVIDFNIDNTLGV